MVWVTNCQLDRWAWVPRVSLLQKLTRSKPLSLCFSGDFPSYTAQVDCELSKHSHPLRTSCRLLISFLNSVIPSSSCHLLKWGWCWKKWLACWPLSGRINWEPPVRSQCVCSWTPDPCLYAQPWDLSLLGTESSCICHLWVLELQRSRLLTPISL